jgi:predicted permease
MPTMSTMLKDAGRALRQLIRVPAFALAVMATLALGFGSVAAIFTIVNAVLIRPLPYADADRLVALHHTAPGWNVARAGMSEATYDHYRRHARLVEDIGVYNENAVNLTDGDQAERVPVALVSPGVMRVLGVRPVLGHLFDEADVAGGRNYVTVMLSHELWTRRYGADPHIVGRLIYANAKPLEVIGVLPPGFAFPARDTAIWYGDSHADPRPSVRQLYLGGIARLKPGVTARMAEDELRGLLRAMVGAYPDATPDVLREGRLDPIVLSLKDDVIGGIKLPLIILLCATALVLLISWANVANLYLMRAESRRHEVALQRALGATTIDLASGFVWESVALVVPAALGGLLLAKAGVTAILGWAALGWTGEPIPRAEEIRLDGAAVGLVIVLMVVAVGFLAGLSLALASRRDLAAALKASGRQQTPGPAQRLTQRGLLALQVGLALVVLIGSAAMLQSLWRLRAVDLGFASGNRLTFTLSLPASVYPTYASGVAFHEQLVRELRALPGVTNATTAFTIPLRPRSFELRVPLSLTDGPADAASASLQAEVNLVEPGYFGVMQIPLRDGQGFDAAAQLQDDIPVVIGETLAQDLTRTLAPAESLLGRRLFMPGRSKSLPYRIVGIARDVIGRQITDGPARMVYVPILPTAGLPDASASQKPYYSPTTMTVIVQTQTPPETVMPLVRDALHAINPRLALADVQTLRDIVSASTARTQLIAMLLAVGATAGLLLALVGVFGVTMHLVSSRQREMAVRFALGARPIQVRRLVLRSVATTLAIGAVAGLFGGFVLTRSLGAMLYGIRAWDPPTFVFAAAIVVMVGLLAGDVPARRAARIDPVRALARD